MWQNQELSSTKVRKTGIALTKSFVLKKLCKNNQEISLITFIILSFPFARVTVLDKSTFLVFKL